MRTLRLFLASMLVLAMLPAAARTQTGAPPAGGAPAAPRDLLSPEGVVRELYRAVCVAPGDTTDWAAVRELFIPEAVVFLRVSKDASSLFSLEGWIQDFVDFNTKARVTERGFEEKITKMDVMVFRDIAHVLVKYEARILDSPRPPTVGVDSIELIRKDGRWWIAAITNDLPSPEHPLPAPLKD
jgi:hypothetical protein